MDLIVSCNKPNDGHGCGAIMPYLCICISVEKFSRKNMSGIVYQSWDTVAFVQYKGAGSCRLTDNRQAYLS